MEEEGERLSPQAAARYARMAAVLAVVQFAAFAILFWTLSGS
jgi:hypothetical protein